MPIEGAPISDVSLAYVKRASSLSQAGGWNAHLADDPVFGPASGFKVGVGPRMDGRFPLVWVRADPHDGADALPTLSPVPGFPPITTPAEGVALNRTFGTADRKSARRQAATWNVCSVTTRRTDPPPGSSSQTVLGPTGKYHWSGAGRLLLSER